MSELEDEFAIKKIKFSYTFLQKTTCFAFLCLFEEHEFKLTNIRRVRFRNKLLNGCQSLKKTLHSKNQVTKNVNPWKHCFMQFSCLFEKQGFHAKKLQCVWLGIQNTTSSQILSLKKLKCIRTWIKTFTTTRFWIERIKTCKILRKKFLFNKARFEICYSVKTTIFANSIVVRNERFRIKNSTMRHIRNWKSTKTEIICSKISQSVRISTEIFEAFPTLLQKKGGN